MTENEAINELQSNIDLPFGFTVSDEVSEIAIKALEEIKQYRAIGTVEELQALKEKENRFDRNIKMFNEIGLEIRNNAIDEFAEALLRCDVIDKSVIRRIAEQMKGEQL